MTEAKPSVRSIYSVPLGVHQGEASLLSADDRATCLCACQASQGEHLLQRVSQSV